MKYLVLGHNGMVGSSICRALRGAAWVSAERHDLRTTQGVRLALIDGIEEQATVFLCAARVGGIGANMARPAEFIRDNLLIGVNVIEACHKTGAKLVYFGSSCIYPRNAHQPISERFLGIGSLEPTNSPYAMAKLACIEMLDAYRRQYGMQSLIVMPCNLYGPGDDFGLETAHVFPALIRRFVEAKESGAETVTLWGTGKPRREFMQVDDCAAAVLHLVEQGTTGVVNIGMGYDVSIAQLAVMIAQEVGYERNIEYDPEQPDGTPRKLLDVRLLADLGWLPALKARPVKEGVREMVAWYRANRDEQAQKTAH